MDNIFSNTPNDIYNNTSSNVFEGISIVSNQMISLGISTDSPFLIATSLKDTYFKNIFMSLGKDDNLNNLFGIADTYSFLLKNQYGISFENILSILNEVKGVYEDKTSNLIQSLYNSILLNDSFTSNQLILSSLELLSFTQSLSNIISNGSLDIQSLLTILSDSQYSAQANINQISNLSDLLKMFSIKNSLYQIPTKFYSYSVKVYLDGSDISNLVNSDITIEKDQSNIHNSITFSSVSETLFNKADPSILEGEIRIEVQIDSTVMYFLLEERSFSSDGSVSYWGRDSTARDNSPWASSISVSLSAWQSAKDLAESLTTYSVVDWDILDWLLPDSFEATGTPVEVISTIASELGAIVRAQDDGSLLVRYQYPVRPVYVKTSSSVYSYSSDLIYGEDYSEKSGDRYNQVTVTADTNDKTAPIVEVEDSVNTDRIIGEDTYIRVFYYEDPLYTPSVTSEDTTDGSISFLKKDTEEITEIITFSNGTGSSSYPLKTLKSVSWLGRTNTILTWEEYSTDIILETEDYCIAEITYDTEYYRYKAYGHSVEELLTVFEIDSTFFSSILVKTAPIGLDDKEGDEIITSYLTDKSSIIKRGENWIDDNKYDTKEVSFNSPFNPLIVDGNIIWADIEKIPSGNFQILSNNITISGPEVINNISVIQWEI